MNTTSAHCTHAKETVPRKGLTLTHCTSYSHCTLTSHCTPPFHHTLPSHHTPSSHHQLPTARRLSITHHPPTTHHHPTAHLQRGHDMEVVTQDELNAVLHFVNLSIPSCISNLHWVNIYGNDYTRRKELTCGPISNPPPSFILGGNLPRSQVRAN